MDLDIEINLPLGMFAKDLAMQVAEIYDLVVHEIVIQVVLPDFFFEKRSGVGVKIGASNQG